MKDAKNFMRYTKFFLSEKVNRVSVHNNSIINREKSLIHYLKGVNDRNFFSRLTSLDLGFWF